jgi:hypothetical protein
MRSDYESEYQADLAAAPTLKEKLVVCKIFGGMPWLAAALRVANVNKLSDMTPPQAARVLAIPLPPEGVDIEITAKFFHDMHEFLYEDGPPPAALDRRTEADLWLCGLVSKVRK